MWSEYKHLQTKFELHFLPLPFVVNIKIYLKSKNKLESLIKLIWRDWDSFYQNICDHELCVFSLGGGIHILIVITLTLRSFYPTAFFNKSVTFTEPNPLFRPQEALISRFLGKLICFKQLDHVSLLYNLLCHFEVLNVMSVFMC